jgi:hypothetical protein
MIIKNYISASAEDQPGLDLQIIEDCTDVLVHATCFDLAYIGDIEKAGIRNVMANYPENFENGNRDRNGNSGILTRHIDFTRNGIRTRLVVTKYAYICNDDGRTVEKVSC